MEIEEYRAQFIDQLRFDADHEGTEPETQFILKTLEELSGNLMIRCRCLLK
jgi:hypothetical protein